MIEGIYALQEWWAGDGVRVPPQVEGRFIIREGAVLTFLHDRTSAVPRYSGTLFGRYELGAGTFAYGYDDALMLIHSPDGLAAGEQLPWTGMREFVVEEHGDAIHVRARSGEGEFRFSAGGFLYLENGKPLRRWRRLDGGV
jgi:hypothetical protein